MPRLNSCINSGLQLNRIDRLGDVATRTLAHTPHPVSFLVFAGTHDDGHIGIERITRNGTGQGKPLTGHDDVHQNQIGLFFGQAAKSPSDFQRYVTAYLFRKQIRLEH